jgi:pimeloyl-ACP methyl ester carboxylesterase
MLTALFHPEVVARLVLWNIIGGIYGNMVLAWTQVLTQIPVVQRLGMEGVARLPDWKQQIELNPANRERLLAFDPHEYEKVMLTWLNAFVPRPGQTVPGIEDDEFGRLTVPTLIISGGEDDLDHPKRMSLEMSTLIKSSTLVDPPGPGPWDWYQAAPLILDFAADGRSA